MHRFGYGNHEIPSFSLSKSIDLNQGNNTLDILSMIIGLQNYGPWFDIMGAGLLTVVLSDLVKGKVDLSSVKWTYQVGLEGEHIGLDRLSMENSSLWTKGTSVPVNQSLIWYKAKIRAPEGVGPL